MAPYYYKNTPYSVTFSKSLLIVLSISVNYATTSQKRKMEHQVDECTFQKDARDDLNCWAPDIHSWTSATWSSNKSEISQPAPSHFGVPRTLDGKKMILIDMQRRITTNIRQRISELGIRREGRGSKGNGMGSTEGALITISLLTFAVYLIKLVMMLINAIHEKKGSTSTGLLASTAQPAGVQTFVLAPGKRKRRSPWSPEVLPHHYLQKINQEY